MYTLEKSFHSLTNAVETPHVRWAKPYIKGPIKALFIAPRFCQREVVELDQRVELDYSTVMLFQSKQLGGRGNPSWEAINGAMDKDVRVQLDRGLEPTYHVIVIGAVDWNILPEGAVDVILRKVNEGTGLVVSLCENVPKALWADVGESREVTSRTKLGKGRVALLEYRADMAASAFTPSSPSAELDYEYYLSFFAKELIWAARADAPVAIRAITVSDGQNRVNVAFENETSSGMGLRLSLVIRSRLEVSVYTGLTDYACPRGRNTATLGFEPLRPGEYFADVIATQIDAKAVDWGTTRFRVPSTVAPLEILPELQGGKHDEKQPAQALQPGEFAFVMWGNATGDRINRMVNRELRKYGVDTMLLYMPREAGCKELARQGYRVIGYGLYIGCGRENLVRSPCLTDPAYRMQLSDLVSKMVNACLHAPTISYDAGSESSLFYSGGKHIDVCFSPTCQEHFRLWLRDQYGTLDAVNAEWGTDYKHWLEVKPMTLDEAKKRGNIAQWADHRMHMETVFAEIHEFCGETIKQTYRLNQQNFKGGMGLAGPHIPDSWVGLDYWKLCKVLGHWAGTPTHIQTSAEQVRSFMSKDKVRSLGWHGAYVGERNDELRQRYLPWANLFHGFNSTWFFKSYGQASGSDMSSALAPDLTPIPALEWVAQEVAEVKRVSKRILLAERQNDGIAIHYSQPSLHASTAYPNDGDWNDAQAAWCRVLESLWLQYDFVASEQIVTGKLAGYRVLILPFSQAMSDTEAETIAQWVQGGGLLIADIRPGVMDEHCKFRANGVLDWRFGVKSSNAGLEVTEGEALELEDGVPRTIVRRRQQGLGTYGEGMSVLLNRHLPTYMQRGGNARELVRGILNSRGVRSEVVILNADAKELPCEVARFKTAGVEYVGILPPASLSAADAVISLNRAAHIYDMRANLALGHTERIEAQVRAGRALLYALCEQEQPDITGGGAT